MEYCRNGSLFDYMRQGTQFTPHQMISWARGIACGMRHLHDRNIVHRDLKSPNVLITENLIAKVSDFGTSRTIDGKSAIMTYVGTVNRMAPEGNNDLRRHRQLDGAGVSDFGTSRTIDCKSAIMTYVGTVNWMAPEVRHTYIVFDSQSK
ncbi:Uncharacterized protein OBRU01_18906, partial [Operophtera brumata]